MSDRSAPRARAARPARPRTVAVHTLPKDSYFQLPGSGKYGQITRHPTEFSTYVCLYEARTVVDEAGEATVRYARQKEDYISSATEVIPLDAAPEVLVRSALPRSAPARPKLSGPDAVPATPPAPRRKS